MTGAEMCISCDVAPAPPDDVLCRVCREWVADNTTEITDPIEIILNRHQAIRLPDFERICHCMEEFENPAAYRRHVADLIYQALDIERR
jgi:hypothetical protein